MRKVLLILAGLVVVVLTGVIILISQVDISDYKEQALAQIEKATGRKVSIEGDLNLSISLNPAIVAENIRFANADWGSRPDMASIKRIEVQLSLLPLLRGGIEVQRFILIEPDVLLEKNAQGKGNWELDTAGAAEQGRSDDGALTAINIGTVLVKQLKLVYRDAAGEKPVAFSIDTLKLNSTDDDQMELELKAALDGTAISVNGKTGSLSRLFDNKDYPVDLSVNIGAASTTLSGVISKPLQGQGIKMAINLHVAKLNELTPLTGAELPAIGPLTVTTSLSDPEGQYQLSDLEMTLADSRISGSITADLKGKIPYIRANLQSPLLNLIPFQAEPPATEEKIERYFTDEPLPLDGLHAANAAVTLKADKIQTRQATLTKFNTRLTLDGGKLTLKPLSMQLAQGTLRADINVDASQKTAAIKLQLDGKNIQLGRLKQLQDTLSGGTTDITLRLQGSGNSTQAIAGGVDGQLLVQIGPAEMKREEKKSGLLASLGKLLNPFSAKDNAMLECAVLNFKIKKGIATANKGIGVETGQITVSGGGDINLSNEKLALGFEPHAKGAVAATITNLASGMKVGGTLADPKIKINPAGVAMGALKSVAGSAGSIVSGIFGKGDGGNVADTAPCRTALTGKSTPAKTSVKNRQTKKPGKVESVTKKVLDAPKKLLKGLFD